MSVALPALRRTDIAHHEPAMSYRLSYAVQQIANPHPDVGIPRQFPAMVQAEARDAIAELAPLCEPVTRQRFERWIQPIGPVVANALTVGSDDYRVWLAGMLTHFSDTAIGAFTAETSRAYAKANDFWPTAKAVNAVVAGPSMALRSRMAHLRRIADAETEPPHRPVPDGPVTAPDWVGDRRMRGASGPEDDGDRTRLPYHEPVRSVAEQLAALGFPDGAKAEKS